MLAGTGCARSQGTEPDCTAVLDDLGPLLVAEWRDVRAGNGVLARLRAIRLGIERQLVPHDEWVTLGWCQLRDGNIDTADRAFREGMRRVRHSTDAAVGRGYTALRRDDLGAATGWFADALKHNPHSPEALEGLALAVERMEDGAPAAALAKATTRELLRKQPGDRELLNLLARAGRKAGTPGEFRVRPDQPATPPRYFARSGRDYLELRTPDGDWQPLFVKGVNIGPATPGRYPSEAPRDEATWTAWLEKIAGIGANAVRVYTLQPPAFYRALAAFNSRQGETRLWLLQGVWSELPPGDDFDDPAYVAEFEAEIARVIDAVHGDLVFSAARGHAQGNYDADVSAYTLGWIIGREWEPFAVVAYDEMNPGRCDHHGEYVTVRNGRAMECWVGRGLDFAAAYEARRHGQGRPLSFSNWPTLDPLHHPTEATRAEEDAWRLQLDGVPLPERSAPAWDDDAIALDSTLMAGTDAFAPGVFASYHVYPNFPYFMNLEPAFAEVEDEYGVNRYAGYLRALKNYHGSQPVLIAEYGMSTSRGVAHQQPEGLHHGGHHEPDAMHANARLLRSIHAAGMAGGVAFQFMDEWFKTTWSTSPFELPEDHRAYWFNAESPEQSYGLWANRPESPVSLSGNPEEWRAIEPLLSADSPGGDEAEGWLRLRRLRATYDAGYLYIALETDGRDPVDWSQAAFVLGLDTYDAERGERRLPQPAGCETASGVEFAVVLRGPEDSALLVTPGYRLRHPAETGAIDRLESPLQPAGRFVMPTLTTNRERYTRDGTRIAPRQAEPGRLRYGSLDPRAPDFDTRADVNIAEHEGLIELRLPWGLLNFADPSSGRVLHQPSPAAELGTRETEGVRIYACAGDPGAGGYVSRLPTAGEVAPLLTIAPWTTPGYRLEPKHGLEVFAEQLESLTPTPPGEPPEGRASR